MMWSALVFLVLGLIGETFVGRPRLVLMIGQRRAVRDDKGRRWR